jgi:DMSO/TMAO reductase YedYZ molybdopterin-dependent catalytic subunit
MQTRRTNSFAFASLLLPEIGHRAVWLALDVDGKPLADESGPVELIVPDDTKPGPWVHGVRAITVIDGAQATALKGSAQ